MRTQYLLPCSCGREIPVEATQAGEQIRCSCGTELEVPTLLKLASLKRVAPTESVPRAHVPIAKTWGARQRILLIGGMITVLGLMTVGWLYLSEPPTIDVNAFNPVQSVMLWHDLKRGVQFRPPAEIEYLNRIKEHHRWLLSGWIVVGAGVVVTGFALLLRAGPSAGRNAPARQSARPTSGRGPRPTGPGKRPRGPGSRRRKGL